MLRPFRHECKSSDFRNTAPEMCDVCMQNDNCGFLTAVPLADEGAVARLPAAKSHDAGVVDLVK